MKKLQGGMFLLPEDTFLLYWQWLTSSTVSKPCAKLMCRGAVIPLNTETKLNIAYKFKAILKPLQIIYILSEKNSCHSRLK